MNERLRTYLRDEGITQGKLADMLGTHDAMVSYWLNGKHTPRPETMQRIEKLTNGAVPMTSWFEGDAA